MRASSTTSNHNGNDDDVLPKIHAMIDHQYTIIEDYCQTQTLVGNLLLTTKAAVGTSQRRRPDSNKLSQAIQQLRKCLQTVQQDADSWNQLLLELFEGDANPNLFPVIQQHVALSQRVLQTIHQPYHANGIPVSTATNTNRHETNTVALATLRASGARLKDAL